MATSTGSVVEMGIRELRDNLSRVLRQVRDEGDQVVVTDHGRAVARLVPLDQPRPLDRLVREGLVTPAARSHVPLAEDPVEVPGGLGDLVADQRR